MKLTWKGIHNLIYNKRTGGRKQVKFIKGSPEKGTSNKTEITNILNNYFATVGTKLAQKLPASNKPFDCYVSEPTRETFSSEPITPLEVESQIILTPTNGVVIDNRLSCKHHINFISSKISKTIGIISKIRHFVSRHIVIKIYQSLIYPYISYGICAWGQSVKTNLKKLLVLQKRAIRLIYFTSNREHAVPYFVQSRILPLDSLFFQQIAYLMRDVDNHIAPKNIVTLFKKVGSVHSYRTRSVSSDKFYLDYSRLNIRQNSFSRLGARIWNSIPPTIRNLRKSSFKKNIKNLLFKVLIEYDDYVDVHKIIQIVPNCNFSTDL